MEGMDLNRPMQYQFASFRYFAPGEHHMTRICKRDVLLLVTEGCLRFSEDGIAHEVSAGEYYIQKRGSHQQGDVASDSPKYLYVHFLGEWSEEEPVLPRRGTFSIKGMESLLKQLDKACHEGRTLAEQLSLFYRILTELKPNPVSNSIGEQMAEYVKAHRFESVTLEALAKRFGYSQNQIINIMQKTFGCSPLQYLHRQRLHHGEWLLRVTSKPLQQVSEECGYGDYSQFYKQFLKIYGISPRQWRISHQE